MDIKKARQAQWIIDKCMISEAREMEKLFPDYFEQGHAYFLPRDPNSYAVFELGNAEKVIEKIRAEVDQAIMDNTTCDCCGKKMTELKPFGGPDDPRPIAEGSEEYFRGKLLVRRDRPALPYDEEAVKAIEEALEEMRKHGQDDVHPFLIAKWGKEKGEEFSFYCSAQSISGSWECRDCFMLDEKEFFITRALAEGREVILD